MKSRERHGKTKTAVARLNITLPQSLKKVSRAVTAQKGFVGLSDYFQACLRKDAVSLGMKRFELAE